MEFTKLEATEKRKSPGPLRCPSPPPGRLYWQLWESLECFLEGPQPWIWFQSMMKILTHWNSWHCSSQALSLRSLWDSVSWISQEAFRTSWMQSDLPLEHPLLPSPKSQQSWESSHRCICKELPELSYIVIIQANNVQWQTSLTWLWQVSGNLLWGLGRATRLTRERKSAETHPWRGYGGRPHFCPRRTCPLHPFVYAKLGQFMNEE